MLKMGEGTPAHINDTQKWVTWASKQPPSNHPVYPSDQLSNLTCG